MNQKWLISLCANQNSLSASVWRFSKNDSDSSHESFNMTRVESSHLIKNVTRVESESLKIVTRVESSRVTDSSHDITGL